MQRLTFWRTLTAQQSRRFPFFAKAAVLVLLVVANLYLSAYFHQYGILANIMLILPWYVLIGLLASFVRLSWTHAYLQRNNLAADHVDNFTVAVKRLSFAATHVVFFFVLFYLLDIPISQFFTSISLFAVALVLLFREYISSFMNGITLMFSRGLRIRDYVKIGDQKGRITDISFLHVELRTELGDVVYIPNNLVLSKEFINFSQQNTKQVAMEFTIPKEFFGRVDELEERLRKVVEERFGDNIKDGGIRFLIERVEKDHAVVSVRVTVMQYTYAREKALQKQVSKEVLSFLSEKL
jgi:small-conductance mechanosensitive channel